ncbi:MAG: CPBP family intramembrane metalloprotease, partial [Oscillospiraceae bacterium]|nr:CPBP family intramembrane metalloprotease [Oscillospiraceae bacterium]
ILYVLFTVLIAPLSVELLLHGCLFQTLRQFGDSFAIATITILSALLTHNLQDAVRMCVVTLTISYFLIKSGSFLTAAILRVVHEIYMFALFYIRTFGEVYSLQWWLLILLPCVLGSVAAICLFVHRKQHPEKQTKSPVYLGIRDQITAFFTAMPMLIFSLTCLLLLVVTTIL